MNTGRRGGDAQRSDSCPVNHTHLRIICRGLSSVNVSGREDLGAQFARITRRLIALEQPLLDKHAVSMWEYAVLLRLRDTPAETQLGLAQAIRYDKTRLIALLDGLEQRGLIAREQATTDRRARTVKLTGDGRAKVGAVQRDIQRMEDRLLGPDQLDELQRLLAQL
jgi:DNA-binding MarR family transcriptional regulator